MHTTTQARVLRAITASGGARRWRELVTLLGAGPCREAVDALVATGDLREGWVAAARGMAQHWLWLPDYPTARLPGDLLPGPPAPARSDRAAPAPHGGHETGIPCPWCHSGLVVAHDPEEAWVVSGDPEEGGRGQGFRTAPVPWFTCTNCGINGTQSWLVSVLAGTVGSTRSAQRDGARCGRLACAV